jgi:hypothetical protein
MFGPSLYYVWRRNDGYVSSSKGSKPPDWRGTDGSIHTFEHLGEFEKWVDAYNLIYKLRGYEEEDRLKGIIE